MSTDDPLSDWTKRIKEEQAAASAEAARAEAAAAARARTEAERTERARRAFEQLGVVETMTELSEGLVARYGQRGVFWSAMGQTLASWEAPLQVGAFDVRAIAGNHDLPTEYTSDGDHYTPTAPRVTIAVRYEEADGAALIVVDGEAFGSRTLAGGAKPVAEWTRSEIRHAIAACLDQAERPLEASNQTREDRPTRRPPRPWWRFW